MKCMWYNFHEFCLNSFCKSNFLQYQYRANNRNSFLWNYLCLLWQSLDEYGIVFENDNYWELKVLKENQSLNLNPLQLICKLHAIQNWVFSQ